MAQEPLKDPVVVLADACPRVDLALVKVIKVSEAPSVGIWWVSAVTEEVVTMRGRLYFVGGLVVGYVLGTTVGKEPYVAMRRYAQRVTEHPKVAQVAEGVQGRAGELRNRGMERMAASRLANSPMGRRLLKNDSCGCCGATEEQPADGATDAVADPAVSVAEAEAEAKAEEAATIS